MSTTVRFVLYVASAFLALPFVAFGFGHYVNWVASWLVAGTRGVCS